MKININAIFDTSFIHFCQDHIEVVHHDVGVVRCEGQGWPDPDGRVSTPAEVDPPLPQTMKDSVSGLNVLGVNSTQRSQTSGAGEDLGEPGLQLSEAIQDRAACLADTVQQTFLSDSFDNLNILISYCIYHSLILHLSFINR